MAITQTRDGYLWLATQSGLVRFDGVRFTETEREELTQTEVAALLERANGELWASAVVGGAYRVPTTLNPSLSPSGTSVEDTLLGDAFVRALHEDGRGALWLGTSEGDLYRHAGGALERFGEEHGLVGGRVQALAETDDGTLWVGTDEGLLRLCGKRLERVGAGGTEAAPSPHHETYALLASRNGTLYAGTGAGLAAYERGAFHRFEDHAGRPDAAVLALFEDDGGALWIGTERGLYRFYRGRFERLTRADGLPHDEVRALFQDREGSLWVGTHGGGLVRLRASRFANLTAAEGLPSSMVLSAYEDRRGALWVGAEGGGLYRLPKGSGEEPRRGAPAGAYLAGTTVLAMQEDASGALWAGTYGDGLCRVGPETISGPGEERDCLTVQDGLSWDGVFALHSDDRGALWVGTSKGVDLLQGGRFRAVLTDNAGVTAIRSDGESVWAGGIGGSLYRLRARSEHDLGAARTQASVEVRSIEGFEGKGILAMHVDGRGALWVGTYGAGLCRLDVSEGESGGAPAAVACLTSEDGLPDDVVVQVLEDDEGALWLGTLSGIVRLSRGEAEARLAARAEEGGGAESRRADVRLRVEVFDERDGLGSREANGGYQDAALRGSNGRLYFATTGGLAFTDPAHAYTAPAAPPVTLEWVRAGGEELFNAWTGAAEAELKLAPGTKRVEFRYAMPRFTAPGDVRYQYRLDGYDEGWVEAGADHEVAYTGLAPRHYRFRVRALGGDGVWSRGEAAVDFEVLPLFHQTGWFRLLFGALAFLLLILLASAVHRLRVRRFQARQRWLEAVIGEQTATVEGQKRELEAQKEALERLNGALEDEVERQIDYHLAERARYEAELVAAKERAEASDRLKGTILQNITHEIRTPVASMLGYAQILMEEVAGTHREFAGYIIKNGNRLLETMGTLLDLAEVEAGSQNLHVERVDVGGAVAAAAERFAGAVEAKGLAFDVVLPAYPLPAALDAAALERVLNSLLGNAVKFTDEGGVAVEVGAGTGVYASVEDEGAQKGQPLRGARAEERRTEVYLQVRDTGVGIGEAFLPRLFEAFEQESDGLDRAYEGSGLGLAITRRLVGAMGGRVAVASRKGKGSTFTVAFPLLEEAAMDVSAGSGAAVAMPRGSRWGTRLRLDRPSRNRVVREQSRRRGGAVGRPARRTGT